MIILSIGSNISSDFKTRYSTIKNSVSKLTAFDIEVDKISSIYHSPPMTLLTKKSVILKKISDKTAEEDNFEEQDYLNICISINTSKSPAQLLYCLKQIEKDAGRINGQRWAERPLDMDIVCYHDLILGDQVEYNKANHHGFLPLTLPHPGMKMRNFVLKPLQEIAPNWNHPVTGQSIHQLIQQLK